MSAEMVFCISFSRACVRAQVGFPILRIVGEGSGMVAAGRCGGVDK